MTDEEIAEWVRHNSLIHGRVTEAEAANIDWVAIVKRNTQ